MILRGAVWSALSEACLHDSTVGEESPGSDDDYGIILKRMKLIAIAGTIDTCCMPDCLPPQSRSEPQPVSQSRNLPVITVSVGAPVEYTTVGSVVSDQRVDVTSRLSGYIRAVLVHEGDRVRRGQVLVRLDASDVEGSIRQAQAGVSAAEAAFRDAEADRGAFSAVVRAWNRLGQRVPQGCS